MEQSSPALDQPVLGPRNRKRSHNKVLVAAILVVSAVCVVILGLTFWSVLGSRPKAPVSAAARDVIRAEAAVNASPKDLNNRVSAAKANYLAGNYDRAIQYADTAIQLGKDVPAADLLKGYALAAKGNVTEARKLYEKVASKEVADSADAYLALAEVDRAAGKYDKAVESLKKAQTFDSTDAMIGVELAKTQVSAGKLDDAVASYARALSMVPDLKEARDGLAEMQYGPAHYELAKVAWNQGRKTEAQTLMEKAVLTSPDLAWLHVALGDFRDMIGDKARAEAAYKDALSIDPRNKEAKAGLASLGK